MSQSGDHLKSGQLGTADVTVSTVANIGPGIDFYFGFEVIAVTAGAAAPLSTAVVGAAVLVQVAIMILFCVVVLVDQRAHLSGIPFLRRT